MKRLINIYSVIYKLIRFQHTFNPINLTITNRQVVFSFHEQTLLSHFSMEVDEG